MRITYRYLKHHACFWGAVRFHRIFGEELVVTKENAEECIRKFLNPEPLFPGSCDSGKSLHRAKMHLLWIFFQLVPFTVHLYDLEAKVREVNDFEEVVKLFVNASLVMLIEDKDLV